MSETKIEFDATYQFCWLKNIGTGDCYVSDHPNIVAEDDDVAFLPTGEAVLMPMYNNAVYVLGDTVIEAHAQNFSDSPFAWNEAGGSDVSVVSLSVNENGTYTAPSGTAYSPVTVSVSPNVGTKTITQDGTYNASSDNLDGYASVTVDTAYHLPDGYTQLDYVECPSSGQAGFVVSSYSFRVYDIHECKTMPFEVQNEGAFAGTVGLMELYYSGGYADIYGNATNLLGSQAAETGKAYYHKALYTGNASDNITIGYYRYGSYPFRGRIYYYKIYRITKSEGIELIYNFIPCVRDADGKVGFYETVNDTFCSSTTGTEFAAPASV